MQQAARSTQQAASSKQQAASRRRDTATRSHRCRKHQETPPSTHLLATLQLASPPDPHFQSDFLQERAAFSPSCLAAQSPPPPPCCQKRLRRVYSKRLAAIRAPLRDSPYITTASHLDQRRHFRPVAPLPAAPCEQLAAEHHSAIPSQGTGTRAAAPQAKTRSKH